MRPRSVLAILLTLFGATLIILTIYLGVKFNNDLLAIVKAREVKQAALDMKIDKLNEELTLLKYGSISEIIKIETIAIKLPGRKTQRRNTNGEMVDAQQYDFSYWIAIPNNRKNDIEKVEYRRRGGELLQKVLTGTEPTNGFAASYTGWGCFPEVEITITEKLGKVTELTFNQCDYVRKLL
jgi:hypothetical protein